MTVLADNIIFKMFASFKLEKNPAVFEFVISSQKRHSTFYKVSCY